MQRSLSCSSDTFEDFDEDENLALFKPKDEEGFSRLLALTAVCCTKKILMCFELYVNCFIVKKSLKSLCV